MNSEQNFFPGQKVTYVRRFRKIEERLNAFVVGQRASGRVTIHIEGARDHLPNISPKSLELGWVE